MAQLNVITWARKFIEDRKRAKESEREREMVCANKQEWI